MGEKKLSGIYAGGYGIVPSAVLKNESLSPESKAIYSYLAIHSRSQFGQAFVMPSEKRICTDLGIAHVRYYKHRKPLEDLGFLKIISTRDVHTNNFSFPRAILSQDCPADSVCLEAAVTQEGILSQGYGLVPRSVFEDSSVDICAKAYYA